MLLYRFLANQERYNGKNKGRRSRKPNNSARRRILREAVNDKLGSAGFKNALELPLSALSVRRMLQPVGFLRYKRITRTSVVTLQQWKHRIAWAAKIIGRPLNNWEKSVSSDEKKFNLDGTDGLRSDCKNIRTISHVFRCAILVVIASWFKVFLLK